MTKRQAERLLNLYGACSLIGLDRANVDKLLRIEKTLNRWAALECGDGNDYASWAIERDEEEIYRTHSCQCGQSWDATVTFSPHTQNLSGEPTPWCPECGKRPASSSPHKTRGGKPYMVRHIYGRRGEQGRTVRTPVADRENGALRRLRAILDPLGLYYYHQSDPRGCALYVSDKPIPDNDYNRKGIAVCID